MKITVVKIHGVLCAALICSACACSYIDNDGARHIIGLVNMKIQQTGENKTYAGKVVDMRNIGIAINKNETGGSLSVGYNRELSGYLRDHALIFGDPGRFTANHGDEE